MNDIYSFYQLISKYQIEVPIIQRDYAQGRNNAKTADIRKSIISSFVKAVQVEDSLPLFLDFVYGRIEGNKFIPFDGQQRLTTLFLFHKYIFEQCQSKSICYHKDHCICKDILRRFSYATRQSSREFCQLLVEKNIIPEKSIKISDNITNQSWFFPDWKKDPTIMGMMTMLDEIHLQLREEQDFRLIAERLTSGCNCPITFHFVDMGEHKLSDETYVKMNARGKNLTPFENFKASLEQYLDEKQETVLLNRFKGKYDEAKKEYTGVDGIWLDLFWNKINSEKDEKELPDSLMMSFFNRHFMNVWRCWYANNSKSLKERKDLAESEEEAQKNHDDFNDKITKIPLYPSKDDFVSWDIYQHIIDNCGVETCLNPIFNILDILCDDNNSIEKQSQAVWNRNNDNKNKWNLFQGYINNNNNRETYPSRVAFFALLNYYRNNEGLKNTSLSQWMRIVWNIVENSTIDSPETYASALRLINELSAHSHNILSFLSDDNLVIASDHAKAQLKEEIAKAKQILAEDGSIRKYNGENTCDTWEEAIEEAEKYEFFKGSIRFLFQDALGVPKWVDFDTKWKNAQSYFDADGVKDDINLGINYKTDALLLKAVLYHVHDFWGLIEPKKFVFDNKSETWKSNILLANGWESAIHQIMIGNLSIEDRPDDCLMYKNLYNSNLLIYVVRQQENSRINWIHHHRALYPPRYDGILLDDDSNKFYRNRILIALWRSGKITSKHKIKECDFFLGWDVNFTYSKDEKQYSFQWNTNNHVFLMSEGKPEIKDETKENRTEKYYCLDVSDVSDGGALLQRLDQLINQYENAQLSRF